MGNPHALVIPYPAQGHVLPLMEISQCLVKHGFKITFVNTEFNHKRVVNALAEADDVRDQIRLVPIADGLEPWEDRNDIGKITEAMLRVMPGKLEELIREINGSDSDEITCVVADMNVGWALEVAEKMGIRRAAFWPASVSLLVLGFSIPKLINDRIVDIDGHERITRAYQLGDQIRLVSISDGLEPSEDRNDLRKLTESILRVMPSRLEELIEEINKTDSDKITCIITDQILGWALEIAEKMGIRRAAYCTAAASMLILRLSVPKLIEDGILDKNGETLGNQL